MNDFGVVSEFEKEQETMLDVARRIWKRFGDFCLSKGEGWRKWFIWLCIKEFLPRELRVYLTDEVLNRMPSFESPPRALRKLIEWGEIILPEWAAKATREREDQYRRFYGRLARFHL